jgi:hypothetical protein
MFNKFATAFFDLRRELGLQFCLGFLFGSARVTKVILKDRQPPLAAAL